MPRLLVIDTETGGFNPYRHSILSLGAVCWRPGKSLDRIELFILEPKLTYTKRALKVNKISIEWLRQNGVDPSEAVRQFNSFLENNFAKQLLTNKINLSGHNVNFDVGFLRRLYRKAGVKFEDFFSYRVLDTASIIRYLNLIGKISLPSASLDDAIKFFNIKAKAKMRHSALEDARVTAILLNKLIALV